MKFYNTTKRLLIALCAISSTIALVAQPVDNSPFAQFGLGDFKSQNFMGSTHMGGLSTAYHDLYHWNVENPASLAFLRYTSFNVGVHVERAGLTIPNAQNNSEINATVWNGNLNYLSIGIPLRNFTNILEERKSRELGLGIGFSLMPYTRTNQSTRFVSELPLVGEVEEDIIREGGTYKLRYSMGAKYKSFSAGFNVGYLFGNLERRQVISLPDDPAASVTLYESDSRLTGFTYSYNLMYTLSLDSILYKDNPSYRSKYGAKSLTFGLRGSPATAFTTESQKFDRIVHFSNRTDTLIFNENVKESGKLGSEIGLGITYQHGRRLKLGVNYDIGMWKKYKNDIDPQELLDYSMFKAGASWVPDPTDVLSYINRVAYQVGFYSGTDPRQINGSQLTLSGVTAGIELPLRFKQYNQLGFLNLGVEYGNVNSDLIKENFWRFNFGVTFTDNQWFIKRKYD